MRFRGSRARKSSAARHEEFGLAGTPREFAASIRISTLALFICGQERRQRTLLSEQSEFATRTQWSGGGEFAAVFAWLQKWPGASSHQKGQSRVRIVVTPWRASGSQATSSCGRCISVTGVHTSPGLSTTSMDIGLPLGQVSIPVRRCPWALGSCRRLARGFGEHGALSRHICVVSSSRFMGTQGRYSSRAVSPRLLVMLSNLLSPVYSGESTEAWRPS
jgi:hypothetical protein